MFKNWLISYILILLIILVTDTSSLTIKLRQNPKPKNEAELYQILHQAIFESVKKTRESNSTPEDGDRTIDLKTKKLHFRPLKTQATPTPSSSNLDLENVPNSKSKSHHSGVDVLIKKIKNRKLNEQKKLHRRIDIEQFKDLMRNSPMPDDKLTPKITDSVSSKNSHITSLDLIQNQIPKYLQGKANYQYNMIYEYLPITVNHHLQPQCLMIEDRSCTQTRIACKVKLVTCEDYKNYNLKHDQASLKEIFKSDNSYFKYREDGSVYSIKYNRCLTLKDANLSFNKCVDSDSLSNNNNLSSQRNNQAFKFNDGYLSSITGENCILPSSQNLKSAHIQSKTNLLKENVKIVKCKYIHALKKLAASQKTKNKIQHPSLAASLTKFIKSTFSKNMEMTEKIFQDIEEDLSDNRYDLSGTYVNTQEKLVQDLKHQLEEQKSTLSSSSAIEASINPESVPQNNFKDESLDLEQNKNSESKLSQLLLDSPTLELEDAYEAPTLTKLDQVISEQIENLNHNLKLIETNENQEFLISDDQENISKDQEQQNIQRSSPRELVAVQEEATEDFDAAEKLLRSSLQGLYVVESQLLSLI